jgi:AcrR family transcriptional regulator
MPEHVVADAGPISLEEPSARQVELLRLAYRLMAAKGMHRMTLQDLADAAGMSKANVVYYFKTKEGLVLTTMRWVLGAVAARIVEATASVVGQEEKIRAMIDAIFVDPRRNRDFYAVYSELIAHASRNRRYADLNGWFREIVTGQYADLIRITDRRSKKDVEEAAMVVRALIDGLFLQWLEEGDWVERHAAYKDLCTRAILASLGASQAVRSP